MKACFWKSCCSGWVAAWGVLQEILLYVQKANNSKLNNVSPVTTPQCWLCVDSHHTANSPAAVTPSSLHWSPVASVLASLERLGCTEYRVAFDSISVLCCLFENLLFTHVITWHYMLSKILSIKKKCFTLIIKYISKYIHTHLSSQIQPQCKSTG